MTASPRTEVALMEGYHSPQLDVSVRLNTNESPMSPPTEWSDELAGIAASIDWNRYPDRSASELRESLGALHHTDPDSIFVANGSNEVLQILLLTYGGPGRRSLTFEPTYALHSHISRLTSTEAIERERNADFTLTSDAVRDAILDVRPDVTFLCSPNNPTGMVEDPDVIRAALGATTGLVVVDEAYGQFAPQSWIPEVANHPALVVTRTFSKTWSMAGARLGYLIAAPEVVEHLWKVVLPYHLDAFKQAAGVAALQHVAAMEERVSYLVEERGRIAAALAELAVETWPSSANFVLFRPEFAEGDAVWRGLVERDVLVRNCSSWPGLAGCLRVTVGLREENDAFLAALTELSVQSGASHD